MQAIQPGPCRRGVLPRITLLMTEPGPHRALYYFPHRALSSCVLWRRYWLSPQGLHRGRCADWGFLCLDLSSLPWTALALGVGVTLLSGPGRAGHKGGSPMGWWWRTDPRFRCVLLPFLWVPRTPCKHVCWLHGLWRGTDWCWTASFTRGLNWIPSLSNTWSATTGIYQPQVSRKCKLRAMKEMQEGFWEKKHLDELPLQASEKKGPWGIRNLSKC